VQLAFNSSNRVADTLESSTILIYLIQAKGLYTQKGSRLLKQEINKEEDTEDIVAN
jgi:hypothetical protein